MFYEFLSLEAIIPARVSLHKDELIVTSLMVWPTAPAVGSAAWEPRAEPRAAVWLHTPWTRPTTHRGPGVRQESSSPAPSSLGLCVIQLRVLSSQHGAWHTGGAHWARDEEAPSFRLS